MPRRPLGERAMTPAERQRRRRPRLAASSELSSEPRRPVGRPRLTRPDKSVLEQIADLWATLPEADRRTFTKRIGRAAVPPPAPPKPQIDRAAIEAAIWQEIEAEYAERL